MQYNNKDNLNPEEQEQNKINSCPTNGGEGESVSEETNTSQKAEYSCAEEGMVSDLTDTLEKAAETKQIGELEQKITQLKDLYVRSQAEIQNIQKRSSDEVKKARDYAISSFAKDIIVVRDYLEMALKDNTADVKTIKTGVELTLKQLIQVFERHLIKEIATSPKDKLDPHLHQAVQTIEVADFEPNTIVDIMQKGYLLSERVLRPAMVTVAK